MWVNPDIEIVPVVQDEMESWKAHVGRGWHPLLDYFAKNIDYQVSKGDMPPVNISQVKEKYGGLRLYTSGGNDLTDILAAFCEDLSYKYCAECGKLAEATDKTGWWQTLCEDCK